MVKRIVNVAASLAAVAAFGATLMGKSQEHPEASTDDLCEPDTKCESFMSLRSGLPPTEDPAVTARLQAAALRAHEKVTAYVKTVPALKHQLAMLAEDEKETGRRLGETAYGGGAPTLYGGGGGVRCPSGYAWGGPGAYCLSDNVYYCQSQNSYTSDIEQNCGSAGCVTAPPGYADYCDNSRPPPVPPPPSNSLGAFDSYPGYAVKGNNDRIIDYVYSAQACADACLNERYFHCASFEWTQNRCVLSASTMPTIYSPPWSLWLRKDYY